MQVGLVTGRETIEIKEMPEPEPQPESAVVQIAFCGICGTDLHAFASGDPYNPAICGHEWVGTVSGLGKEVRHIHEGDRVAIGVPPACGQCAECRGGDATHCAAVLASMLGIGPASPPHGGFAPAIAVHGGRLYAVRPELSNEDAAILEPTTVAVHALRRTPLHLGDSVVVLGAGPIGLLVLQCALAAGAGCALVVEPEPSRAKRALDLGATLVVDPRTEDVGESVRRVCGPAGADVVFECAGIPSTIDQSATLVRRGGVVSLVGLSNVPAEITPGSWLVNEVRLVASLGYLHEEFDIAMQLIADGRVDVGALHTGTVGLAEMDGAFRKLLGGGGDIKLLVDPRA